MNWIERRIRECAEKQLPELDLSIELSFDEGSQDRLRDLPPEIPKLTHLKSLILDYHPIGTIPSTIAALNRLERLSLKYCELSSVNELANLASLKELNLIGNYVADVSALTRLASLDISSGRYGRAVSGIDRLVDLRVLRLGATPIPANISGFQSLEELASENADPKLLSKLSGLITLTLGNANAQDLELLRLLKNLKFLKFRDPQFERIPIDLMRSLAGLEAFRIYVGVTDKRSRPIGGLAELFSSGQFRALSLSGVTLSKADYSAVLANHQLEELELGEPGIDINFADLVHMTGLEKLMIGAANVSEVPESIGVLSHLRYLNLYRNIFETLPDNIDKLSQLETLWLYGTGVRSLPQSLDKLKNLKVLSMGGNGITEWPESVHQLPHLKELMLRDNKISCVPPSISSLRLLEKLDLGKNPVTVLSEEVAQLPRLKILSVEAASLTNPPAEIASRGLAAIQQYFDALAEKDATKLFEAKLIIVGEGEVGKTCLAYKIADPSFDLETNRQLIKSTEGIHIKNWLAPTSVASNFKVNIWDFGGQEIYHSTHQFFLTRRSLYLFVWDARKEDRLQGFDYWLNAVRLLSAGSPAIIVLNKADERIKEIDQKQIADRFPNIVGFHKVSALTGTGMQALRENICSALATLPHAGARWPGRWNRVRQAIEADTRNYISYEEYLDLAGVEAGQAATLSGYLHDLGVILHFQDDPLLQRIVILKPEWGTNAVYAVLDTKSIQQNNGRFRFSQLQDIWGTTKYPPSRHPELLQLMIRFELCYRLADSDEYIAPELLSARKPDFDWNPRGNLEFEYRYTFMPAGIMTRFIARNHQAIEKNRSWKNGVVLAWDRSRAMITAEPFDKRIRIAVGGENKRDVLATIRYDIAQIHKTLNNPDLEEMVPCICATCLNGEPFFFRYSQLRGYSQNQIPEIRCDKSYKTVSVEQLLTGVYRDTELAASAKGANPGAEPSPPPAPPPATKEPAPNAWRSGSFPLVVFVVGSAIALLAALYSAWLVPVVLLGGAITVSVVGAFQLRQDDRLSEKNFLQLMTMSLAQFRLKGS